MRLALLRSLESAPLIVRDFLPTDDTEKSAAIVRAGLGAPLLAADGTPCTLTLMSPESPAAKARQYRRTAAARNRLEARLHAGSAKGDATPAELTPEDIEREELADLEDLVALTVGWHGFEDDDGQPVPFSPENVRALYLACPPIRQQALTFALDGRNFLARNQRRTEALAA
jgi:hypothetical protein